MTDAAVDPYGIRRMIPKAEHFVIEIDSLRSPQAHIIKQKLLSLGADAAVSRQSLIKDCQTPCIIIANRVQLNRLRQDLSRQPFGLAAVAKAVDAAIQRYEDPHVVLQLRDKKVSFRKPRIMGILNVTPDSFSGDGLLVSSKDIDRDALAQRVDQMIREGMDIVDIGGESSRPGSRPVEADEEIKRVIPVVSYLRKRFPRLIISLDTYKARVAEQAAGEAGIDIINDITALRGDAKMHSVVKKHKLGVVLMHMQGKPRTMQRLPRYHDICRDIVRFFTERIGWAGDRGITPERIVIDTGIGFGKMVTDNLELIRNLSEFKVLGRPILIGTSRKSFIGHILKQPDPRQRTTGTTCSILSSLIAGAHMVRVHQIKEAHETIQYYSHVYS